MINLQEIRSTPKLYLFNYLHLGGAAMYASFIKSVYEEFCFARPHSVKLFLQGESHFVYAEGCFLNLDETSITSIPQDYDKHQGLVDWLFGESLTKPHDIPNPLLPFQGFALIIFLAEWCVADVSTPTEHFRQIFYQGQAVTPCERRSIGDLPKDAPFIQLQFVLAEPQFHSRVVTPAQIRQAFSNLKKYHLVPKNLRLTRMRLIEDGFVAKIQLYENSK